MVVSEDGVHGLHVLIRSEDVLIRRHPVPAHS